MIKFVRIISVILLICWMTLIFSLSSQNADTSSETSGSIIKSAVKLFVPDFETLSEEEQNELIEPFQFIVRKTAHFAAYTVLGFLAFLSIATYKRIKLRLKAALSAVFCFLFSVSDEIHQLFIPGRSGEIRDVCIDFCGSLLAISLMLLIIKFSKRKYVKIILSGDYNEKKRITEA